MNWHTFRVQFQFVSYRNVLLLFPFALLSTVKYRFWFVLLLFLLFWSSFIVFEWVRLIEISIFLLKEYSPVE